MVRIGSRAFAVVFSCSLALMLPIAAFARTSPLHSAQATVDGQPSRYAAITDQQAGVPLRRVDWNSVLANDPNLIVGADCISPPLLARFGPCITVPSSAAPAPASASGTETDPSFTGYADTAPGDILYADLDGDGQEEAVIRTESGGTGGSFGALVYHQASPAPQLVAIVPGYKLALQIVSGAFLAVTQPYYFASEANCCPTAAITNSYALGSAGLYPIADMAVGLLGPDSSSPSTPAAVTVAAFYRALGRGDYAGAYTLLSPSYQALNPFDSWRAGYATTQSFDARVSPADTAGQVLVTITAVDRLPSGGTVTRRLAGVWYTVDDLTAPLGKYLDRAAISVISVEPASGS